MLLSRPHRCPSFPSHKPLQFSSPPPPVLPQARRAPSHKPPCRPRLRASLPAGQEVLPRSAIQRIAEKLRSLGYLEEAAAEAARGRRPAVPAPGSAGNIFIPTPQELPNRRVGHTIDSSWSTPESPVPVPGSGSAIARVHELRRELGMDSGRVPPTPTPPTVAELTVPAEELRRLRSLGIRLEKKLRLKVGKAGITEGIVNSIHERWRRSELVKIQCEDLCRMNMKRTHEILERKTGGLVIWRSGSIIILYRGTDYQYPYFTDNNPRDKNVNNSSSESDIITTTDNEQEDSSSCLARVTSVDRPPCIPAHSSLVAGVGSPNKVRFQLPGEVQLGEEADKLLDGLGPRFTDWWGCDPLPIDADLLPAVVPGCRKPFRLLPFGLNPKLTDREMTILRRLSRPLPCHFALGRNRNLQGLALSMLKLWEKCEIAKIAIKRGARSTNTELMTEELKRLTGGTLLSRDKDYIVFYRGKDFLPSAVSSAIRERRNFEMHKQKHSLEESSSIALQVDGGLSSSIGPTVDTRLSTVDPTFTSGPQDGNKLLLTKAKRLKIANLAVENMEAKLSHALEKKEKAEKLLEELEESIGPSKAELEKQAISEEERFMLRKVGLRMKAFLLLGRRGVFDGTIENMHLHWKYRELVKIIFKDRCIENVHREARTLEAASGGILVAVERVNKGYAIIVYRGKNYRRPAALRPRTLLNKKEALKRSLEAQRHQSLKLHVLKLSRGIDKMRHQLENNNVKFVPTSSTEHENSSSVLETGDHPGSVEYSKYENIAEVDEGYESDVISLYSTQHDDAPSDMEENGNLTTIRESPFILDYRQDELIDSNEEDGFSTSGNVLSFAEPDSEMNAVHDKAEYGSRLSLSQGKNIQQRSSIFDNASLERESSSEPPLSDHDSIFHRDDMKGESNTRFLSKVPILSNKERLILRKQALNMKKRPVFAIGRNNVITGVAKAITEHFKKYPLAIVFVKGRAKGTSIQELVFELEQATGAVMVSREPSKIILYRGWGEQDPFDAKEKRNVERSSEGKMAVSSQLMAAIGLECGVLRSEEEDLTL